MIRKNWTGISLSSPILLSFLFTIFLASGVNSAPVGAQESLPELVRRAKPSVVAIVTYNQKNEALISGRADASIGVFITQLSAQSWGTSLTLAGAVGAATDSLNVALTICFSGNLAQPSGDSVSLINYTVLRYSR